MIKILPSVIAALALGVVGFGLGRATDHPLRQFDGTVAAVTADQTAVSVSVDGGQSYDGVLAHHGDPLVVGEHVEGWFEPDSGVVFVSTK